MTPEDTLKALLDASKKARQEAEDYAREHNLPLSIVPVDIKGFFEDDDDWEYYLRLSRVPQDTDVICTWEEFQVLGRLWL